MIFGMFSCTTSIIVPKDFAYKAVNSDLFTLASWQKVTDSNAPYKIYIEGDGYAFTPRGRPSKDPTPRSHFLRNIAFNDTAPNVIYLARPCQYIMSDICSKRHWSTARFSPEVINSTKQVIESIAKKNEVILIGYSGGAQVAGLVAVFSNNLNISKLITIAGNIDHEKWTTHYNLIPLSDSLSLNDYKKIYLSFHQLHIIGTKDKVIPMSITKEFIGDDAKIIEVNGATHNRGFEGALRYIYE